MKIVITSGGTTEKIDTVRTISNNSTGRLGAAIAEAFIKADALSVDSIYYICGQNAVVPQSDKVKIIRVGGVSELIEQMNLIMTGTKIDAVIHSMAVSDYTVDALTTKDTIADKVSAFLEQSVHLHETEPELLASQLVDTVFSKSNTLTPQNKISSDINDLIIVLKKTPKVISLIKKLNPNTILVGFKLLSNVPLDTLIDAGYNLLAKNKCDVVLANDLIQINAAQHKGYLISPDKTYQTLETKDQIAGAIVKHISEIIKSREK